MKNKFNKNGNKSGVYKITNINNGKVYIGSAKRFKQRANEHVRSLNKGTHHNKYLQGSWNKHGSEAFIFEVLEVVEGTQTDRLKVEEKYIALYHDNQDMCYNFVKTQKHKARSCFSKTPEETRQKISENMKRIASTPEHKKKISEDSKKRWKDPELRRRMSEARKEKWKDPEYRKKMLKVLKGNKHGLGIKQSEETKKKRAESLKKVYLDPEYRKRRSEASKKMWQDPEYREKILSLKKGKKLTDEWKRNISKGNKGKTISEAQRKKHSETMKQHFKNPEYRKKMREAHLGKKFSEEHKQKISEGIKAHYRKLKISNS